MHVQSFVTSLEFGCIWMDGKRSKRGCGNLHSRACCSHVLRFGLLCFALFWNPVGSSQLRSRSSSPWGAWLFFFCLSKNDDRSLNFICRHARFYLDHKCEINSKRLDPPRSPQGYSLPKRTHGGGPAPWILSHSNFRSGTLILSLEGWAH